MRVPKIGLIICNSGASNSGFITGLAATRIIGELDEVVGICSLPAIANNVPRQIALIKRLKHLIVVDGCHNKCASKILNQLGISYEAYVNLEDLGIRKLGPFTTLRYRKEDVEKVYQILISKIRKLLHGGGDPV